MFVPGLRIPKPVNFSQSLGDDLSKHLIERLSALRTRVVVIAGQETQTATKPKRKAATQHGLLYFIKNWCVFINGTLDLNKSEM